MYQGHKTVERYRNAWRDHVSQIIHIWMEAGDSYGEACVKREELYSVIDRNAHKLDAAGKFDEVQS